MSESPGALGGSPASASLSSPASPTIVVVPDCDAMAIAVRTFVEGAAVRAVAARGRFRLALAGGSTPRTLYAVWGETLGNVSWNSVDIFFGDERAVPPDDAASNYRMVRETLLDRIAIPAANVNRMTGEAADLDAAARAYEANLTAGARAPWIDLAILGIGNDGHTASLFPGAAALAERARLCLATDGLDRGPRRLTLTMPVFLDAGAVLFAVAGAAKADVLRRVLATPSAASVELPSQTVLHRARGAITLCCDRAASAEIPTQAERSS